MFTVELNNAHRDEVRLGADRQRDFKAFAEICQALFTGADAGKYGRDKDKAVQTIKKLGEAADAGDWKSRAEINEVVKFMIEPRLLESMKIFSFLGNYHEIGYDQQPMVKTHTYEGLDARVQASGGDVLFAGKRWLEYPITTQTISSGMVIDYRELASGNFSGSIAQETSQVQTDINNKGVAYVMSVLNKALRDNTKHVKFFAEYADAPTQKAVDDMITKVRKLGKVNICGDFGVLAAVCDWNGYKTVGGSVIPFYSQAQADELARAGLNGFYKGCSLVELPNPYNYAKPLADKSAFETYYDADKLYFTVQGNRSPLNIFRRGRLTSMTGNDVETGVVKTRFDVEIGADVVKGREFEIGALAKQA